MNENINDFIYKGFIILLFVAAVSLFLKVNIGVKNNINIFSKVYDQEIIIKDKVVLDTYLNEGQIIGMLLEGVNYDIEVDGILYQEKTIYYDYSGINKGEYQYTEVIDNSGELSQIIFVSR